MNRNRLIFARFATIGFAVAILIFLSGYWANAHRSMISQTADGLIQVVSLILCPPSLALMANENANVVEQGLGMLIIALTNAGIYGLIGTTVFKVLRRAR
jgi:hypothetical protein